jgi:hypothetical protein
MDLSTDTRSQVQAILERHVVARDSDAALMAYWARYHLPNGAATTLQDYLKRVHDKQAPAIESITRLRRKVQEDRPELRGIYYDDKRTTEADSAQQQLGYGVR